MALPSFICSNLERAPQQSKTKKGIYSIRLETNSSCLPLTLYVCHRFAVLVTLSVLLIVSIGLNAYQFRLRTANVITAEVEYSAW